MTSRLCAVLLGFLAVGAQAASPQPRGYITSATGKKCWYAQTAERTSHFHNIPATTWTLVFSDQRCMSAVGLDGEVNARQINTAIARWYSHADADFAVGLDELHRTSPLQARGLCMQSRTYPGVGVVVEYFAHDGYLSGVKHAPSVGACTG